MYKLTVKDSVFTIPKQNLRLLAIVKAQDLKMNVKLDTQEDVLKFFNEIGIEVEEV